MLGVMEKHGVENVQFAGFMADNAQTNFNVVCVRSLDLSIRLFP